MRITIILILSTFFQICAQSQSYYDIANAKSGNLSYESMPIIGLWEVIQVTVGEEELTPTAKWIAFLEDGKMLSGNGGITHIRGSWTFDQNTQMLNQISNGQQDPYGGFKVDYGDNNMGWTRMEDGMPVKVELARISEKPMAPWDLILGSWQIKEQSIESKGNITSPEKSVSFNAIYIGWDGRYRKFDQNGKRIETGIWHIESHSPWLWTISDADNTKTGWSIEFVNNTMTWIRENEDVTLTIRFEKVLEN
jgi:hypothetical protein